MLTVFPSGTGPSDSLLGHGLGTLPCAMDDTVSQKINGDWCLRLTYPAERPGAALLANDRLILSSGQLYRIRRVRRVQAAGKRLIEVEAPHVAFDLSHYCIENIETDANEETPGGIDAETALTALLQGTPFSVGIVDVPNTLDHLDVLQKDVMSCLRDELVKKWGGELVFDNWTIHLRQACGQARAFRLSGNKNVTALKYAEDLSAVVTRLHVVGYGGADIRDVNDGKDYLDSRYIGGYSHVMEGYAEFPDEDDPAVLKALGEKRLAEIETPGISYDLSLASLSGSPQYALYAPLETYELGDTALLFHEALGAQVSLRCTERVFSALTGVNQRVTLGNAREVIGATLSAAKDAFDAVGRVTTARGALRAGKLEGVINALKTCLYASAEYQTAEVVEHQGILLENNQVGSASYGAMYLGPGIFAIANAKDQTGAWVWRTFGNGAGFSADQITAGTLSAARLDIENLDLSSNTTFLTALGALQKGISQGSEAPSEPSDGDLWLDMSEAPSILKRYTVSTDAGTDEETAGWEIVSDMAAIQAAVSGLSADMTTLRSTAGGLSAQIAEISGAAQTLSGQQAALSNGLLAVNENMTRLASKEELEAEEAARNAAVAAAAARVATVESSLTELNARAGELTLTLEKTVETLSEHGSTLQTYNQNFTFDSTGLTIGRQGSVAKFKASNAEMSVKNGLFEAVSFGRNDAKEWIIAASQSGLGIKHI